MPGDCRYDLMRATIDAIDLVAREVQVSSGDKRLTLQVPVTCQIIMYDDRVRLRLLQPGDAVEVMFTFEDGQAVAQGIEVMSPVAVKHREAPEDEVHELSGIRD